MRERLVHKVLAMYRMRHNPIRVALARGKEAKTPAEIISGLNPDVVARASDVKLLEVSHNPSINQLEYKAQGRTKSQYTVMIRAVPEGDETKYWKSDVLVSCSCRFWRYSGSEYHAHKGEYLYSRENPLGTVESPDVRDADGHNYICKHVYRALQEARNMYFDMDTF